MEHTRFSAAAHKHNRLATLLHQEASESISAGFDCAGKLLGKLASLWIAESPYAGNAFLAEAIACSV